MRIALLTSGGDAPGMNAAIRAATLLATAAGAEVFGVRHGYHGLVHGDLVRLRPGDVSEIIREGGTLLGSARCLEFHERATRDQAREHLQKQGIEGLIVIGGNGSLTGLQALIAPDENTIGLRGIGLPASIDNDIGITRLAIGVDTAVNTIVEACDKISDTASAHDRTFIVEVMGRDCGYLAMTSAIASGANAVLFPEMDKTEDEIVATVTRAVLAAHNRKDRSKRVLVIMAEGVGISTDKLRRRIDEVCAEELGEKAQIETRVTVLGHVVRGGRPSALDRQIASRLAYAGVRGLMKGETNKMAAWLPAAEIPEGKGGAAATDPQCSLVDLDYVLEQTRAMLDGSSDFTKWRRQVFKEIEAVLTL